MLRTDMNIVWRIQPEDVWKHFTENRADLANEMHVVCERQTTNDAHNDPDKWWLFVTTSFEGDGDNGGDLMLSLEDNETVIDSCVLTSPDGIEKAIDELLAKL